MQEQEPGGKACPLGNQCAGGYARYSKMKDIHKNQAGRDIDDIDRQRHPQQHPRVLHPQHPSRQGVGSQHGGSPEDQDMEIERGQAVSALSGIEETGQEAEKRIPDKNHQYTGRKGDKQRAAQDKGIGPAVSCAAGLG